MIYILTKECIDVIYNMISIHVSVLMVIIHQLGIFLTITQLYTTINNQINALMVRYYYNV